MTVGKNMTSNNIPTYDFIMLFSLVNNTRICYCKKSVSNVFSSASEARYSQGFSDVY